ncbi:1129_t:CDS:2, partial [Acaulospora colombiana]
SVQTLEISVALEFGPRPTIEGVVVICNSHSTTPKSMSNTCKDQDKAQSGMTLSMLVRTPASLITPYTMQPLGAGLLSTKEIDWMEEKKGDSLLVHVGEVIWGRLNMGPALVVTEGLDEEWLIQIDGYTTATHTSDHLVSLECRGELRHAGHEGSKAVYDNHEI